MKNERHEAILDIIEHYDIERQEDLLHHLEERGFLATQATISRDIKSLKLMKGIGPDGKHKYILPPRRHSVIPKFNSTLTESIIKVDAAENLLVVKTFPGMAGAVATCVDSFHLPEIIGCVAGDDAILVVMGDRDSAMDLRDKLRQMIDNG